MPSSEYLAYKALRPGSPESRHALLKLPLEERRAVLREQAAAIAQEYNSDPDLRAWRETDLRTDPPLLSDAAE